jgi:hypothetical protein
MNYVPKVCNYHGRNNEPCYGEISEYYDEKEKKWIDYCEGHTGVPYGGFYIPKDPLRRWIFSQQNSKIRRLQAENDLLREMVIYADVKLKLQEGEKEIEIPEERLEILNYD